ncbi:hypothetical protein Ancab_034674 [Ancistrocladus abbreviatus]
MNEQKRLSWPKPPLLPPLQSEIRQSQEFSNLKKQIQQLLSGIDAANADLDNAKRLKAIIEQELKCCEVELAMNQATTQTLKAWMLRF